MSMNEPHIRVTKGDPAPEEVAALVAALAQKSRQSEAGKTARPSTWAEYWRTVRTPLRPGPDAWRVSGLPHS